MSSRTAISPLFWSKVHPPNDFPVRPSLPSRPATSPTVPTPPVPPKDVNVDKVLPPTSPAPGQRWSEVVPPSTALTFAAIWDPEEGLVTFSNASLSASEDVGIKVSPEDADARSQVLTVDFLNLGSVPTTAKESSLFPYASSRFAASEVSTQRFPASPTRRSSVGTGLALDTVICSDIAKPNVKDTRRQMQGAHRPNASVPNLEKPLPPRGQHQHSVSHDSAASHTLSTFGSTLCNVIRRVASPRQGPSRAERYAFLRRSSAKPALDALHGEKDRNRGIDSGSNTPTKSPGFRSMFARSIWHRGGVGADHNGGILYRSQVEESGDGITLDSGFDCLDVDSAYGTWRDEHGGGQNELDAALQRDVNQLKSTFSWTTTSTSRYIDVAAYLENDSDTDSTVSSLGAPIVSTASPFHSQLSTTGPAPVQQSLCESPWLSVEPPTPRATPEVQQPKPQRNLLRKPSKTRVACPALSVQARPSCSSDGAKVTCNRQQYRICPQCHLRIECVDLEAEDAVISSKKGKGRANSQSDLPEYAWDTVDLGRPAAVRSSSSPANLSMPFSHHKRTQSLPGSCSGTATPAEVLARASYNHEWATPVPSPRHNISHVRSPSAPQPGAPATDTTNATSTTMSMRRSRSTTPTSSRSTMRTCSHFAGDVRDVLRGLQSGIRPSTPIPGMPPVPTKHRPPPTSFRPVSAGGARERGRFGRPSFSSSSHTHVHTQSHEPDSHLARSQSHRVSQQQSSLRSRFRSRSLESLRGTAHALASVSTAPLRTLWRAGSFIRQSRSDQPRRPHSSENDEDTVWVCIDIDTYTTPKKANIATSGRTRGRLDLF